MEGEQAVVGIDPSLTGLAVCVLRPDMSFEMQRFTSEPARGLRERMNRYGKLVWEVNGLLAEVQFSAMFLEGYSFGSKGNAILDIAEFGGLLREMLLSISADTVASVPHEIPPSCIKKFVTGTGKGKKIGVITGLVKRYGVEFETDDEFDSYALARMAACYVGWDECQTAVQREVIDGIRGIPKTPKRKVRAAK